MSYPTATQEQIESFREHGWLVVEDAVDLEFLDQLEERCDELIRRKHELAFDWAWDKDEERDKRSFKIVQSSPTLIWSELMQSEWRLWAAEFGSALLGQECDFWYDQFLGKPPHNDAPTYWHQDEGYWGRNLDNLGLTCWTPLQDVDERNGCMFFIDGGHKDGVLEHRRPEGVQSDLLMCSPDESRTVSCPISVGSVTFHHSKTPHMTTANNTDEWRKAVTQHVKAKGVTGEGGHYPWKIWVNQHTGETIIPERS